MATEVQFRRYDTTTISSLTGLEGEVFVDLNKDTLVVQDGSTAGGFPLQPELTSGSNIRTINNTSLLGSGNIAVQEVLVSGTNIKTVNDTSLLGSGNVAVQEVLVSGSNIKTVNGNNILGAGDIDFATDLAFANNTLTYTDIDGNVENFSIQEELVSGTNIKTVNGNNLLGAGDIDLATSISLVGNELRYTDIDGNTTTISLEAYLDDTTNTVLSATLNANTVTFTREDSTTFDLDVTNLYDDTNLVTSVAGRTGDVTLTESDITDLGSYVPLSGGTMTGNLSFGDDDRARFGSGNDLQIYHTGANSYIEDAGNGNLYLSSNGSGTIITGIGGTQAEFFTGGAVNLYYNSGVYADPKLSTAATGVDVTGTITTDGLSIGTQNFPASDGTTDQLLSTDGAGTLSWVDAPSGGATTLDGLTDTDFIGSPSADQIIRYSDASLAWVLDDLKTINGASLIGSGDITTNLDLLATSTLSNTATAEFTAFDSTKYDNYVFVLNIKASSGSGNELEMQIANTSNSTLSIKAVRYTEDSGGNNKIGTSGQWSPIAGDNNIEDISGAHGMVYLFNAHDPAGGGGRVHYKAEFSHGDVTTLTPYMTRAAGFFSGSATDVGYVRFALDTANMDGAIKMYGIKN